MGLLNERQLEDIMSNVHVCDVDWFEDLLRMWNNRQTTQQIEIDWNDAPKNATKAALRLHWVTEDKDLGVERWSASFDSVTFERPKPIITPHPHAVLMTKYAEVAQRRRDPWVEFEIYNESFGNWVALEVPTFFDAHLEYRHIGDNK